MFPRNKNLLAIVLLCFSIFIQSCAKDDGISPENLEGRDGFSGIAAFNAIGKNSLILFIDDKQINKEGDYLNTGGYLGHRTIFPGKRSLELKTEGGEVLYATEKVFLSPKMYTFFFFGENKYESLVTEDDVIKADPGKMKIWLVNLVLDSKLKLDFKYLTSTVSHNLEDRVFGLNEYASKEDFKFKITSTDQKYEDIEIPLDGKDRSVISVVLYSDLQVEGDKKVIKYKILEL